MEWRITSEVICPLCDRPIPPSQQDKHHLVPRLKGGKETQVLHRICHRQIHALFSEAELAQHYATAKALLTHPEIQKFVVWVKKRPHDYLGSVKLSERRR
jgi:hypothetical protein